MAQEFSIRGWKIAGCARNIKELESLKPLLQTDHLLHPFDITISEEVDSFSQLVEIVLTYSFNRA